jgi:hypothetical protein
MIDGAAAAGQCLEAVVARLMTMVPPETCIYIGMRAGELVVGRPGRLVNPEREKRGTTVERRPVRFDKSIRN